MLSQSSRHQINFTAINSAALARLPAILNRLLPRGQRKGREFVGLNPRRADHHLGSFRINLDTGRWAVSPPETRAATFAVSGSVTSSTTILPRRTAPRAAPGPRLAFEATLPHSIPPTPTSPRTSG
jgi:hypothetical protein